MEENASGLPTTLRKTCPQPYGKRVSVRISEYAVRMQERDAALTEAELRHQGFYLNLRAVMLELIAVAGQGVDEMGLCLNMQAPHLNDQLSKKVRTCLRLRTQCACGLLVLR